MSHELIRRLRTVEQHHDKVASYGGAAQEHHMRMQTTAADAIVALTEREQQLDAMADIAQRRQDEIDELRSRLADLESATLAALGILGMQFGGGEPDAERACPKLVPMCRNTANEVERLQAEVERLTRDRDRLTGYVRAALPLSRDALTRLLEERPEEAARTIYRVIHALASALGRGADR